MAPNCQSAVHQWESGTGPRDTEISDLLVAQGEEKFKSKLRTKAGWGNSPRALSGSISEMRLNSFAWLISWLTRINKLG